jgi:hypothetical protein
LVKQVSCNGNAGGSEQECLDSTADRLICKGLIAEATAANFTLDFQALALQVGCRMAIYRQWEQALSTRKSK